jgi:hypothetical protein
MHRTLASALALALAASTHADLIPGGYSLSASAELIVNNASSNPTTGGNEPGTAPLSFILKLRQ